MTETTTLHPGHVLRLDALPGEILSVRQGRVWLTHCDDPADHVLRVGDRAEMQRQGRVVVSAFEPSLLALYRADRSGVRERLQQAAERERTRAIGQAIVRAFAMIVRWCSRDGTRV